MAYKKHRLTLFQRKLRSIIKRFFINFINKSDAYIVQHIPEFIGRNDIHFETFRKIWVQNNHKNNNSDLVRLLFLISNIQEILLSNTQGAFAELGVYKGNSAKILHTMAPSKKLYLFDTFSGFKKKDITFDMKKDITKHKKDAVAAYDAELINPDKYEADRAYEELTTEPVIGLLTLKLPVI